jgi:hypothetical protein
MCFQNFINVPQHDKNHRLPFGFVTQRQPRVLGLLPLPLPSSYPCQPPTPVILLPLQPLTPGSLLYTWQPPTPDILQPLGASYPCQPPTPGSLLPLAASYPWQPPTPGSLLPLAAPTPGSSYPWQPPPLAAFYPYQPLTPALPTVIPYLQTFFCKMFLLSLLMVTLLPYSDSRPQESFSLRFCLYLVVLNIKWFL